MPFGCQYVVLNHWPYNQICIGCKFDRVVEDKNDEFFGRGSICMRSMEADYCVRNNHNLSEEEAYKIMETEDNLRKEAVIKEMNEHNLAQANTPEQLEIAIKINQINNDEIGK